MMQMGIIPFQWAFFHDKNSPQSDPDRVEDHQRKCNDKCSYFSSSDHGEICKCKSEKHDTNIPNEPQRLIFYKGRYECNHEEHEGNVFDEQQYLHISIGKLRIFSENDKLNEQKYRQKTDT